MTAPPLAPVFNPDHRRAALAQRLTPLVFDTETLLEAQSAAAETITPRELASDNEDDLRRLYRTAIDEFTAFALASEPMPVAEPVSALAAVRYRHARWIARALAPAWTASRAPAPLRSPIDEPISATHLLDGRPPALADDTLLAIALGAAGATPDIRADLPPAPAPRCESPPSLPEPRTIFIAGPVEIPLLTRVAAAWNERNAGAPALLVTKDPIAHDVGVEAITEDDLLGDTNPPNADPIDLAPLLDHACAETRRLLWSNPGLAPHLRFITTDYARAMRRQIARWTRLLETARVERIVAAYPHVALDVAAGTGIPATLLPHGPMVTAEDELYRSVAPEVALAAVGRTHADRLAKLQRQTVRLTGLPAPEAAEAHPAPPCDVLLLTVEPARPRDAGDLPRIWADQEINALRALAHTVDRRGWRLRVRRHPRYDRSEAFYRTIFGARLDLSPAGRPLTADAASAAALVTFSGPSSVILDVSTLGAPVILGTAPWAHAEPETWGLDEWPIAPDADTLDRMLAGAIGLQRAALVEQTVDARRRFDGGAEDPVGAMLDLIAGSGQPRTTTRTTRETRSVISARA
jgi:hypothetical protein